MNPEESQITVITPTAVYQTNQRIETSTESKTKINKNYMQPQDDSSCNEETSIDEKMHDSNLKNLEKNKKIEEETDEKKEKNEDSMESEESQKSSKKKGKSTPFEKNVAEIYSRLKLHYNKIPAMFRLDGIRKKIKTHFFNWLKKSLDKQLKKLTAGHKVSKFLKLNQNTIANINLQFNSELLKKTLYDVYIEDKKDKEDIDKLEFLRENSNKKKIEFLKENSDQNFKEFLKKDLFSLYKEYLSSKEYKKDFSSIEEKISEDIEQHPEDADFISLYLEIYKKFSENFADYYSTTLPNHRSYPKNQRPIKETTMENTKKKFFEIHN